MLNAECHCGNIKLLAAQVPSELTSCNCSFCHRVGALWAYYDLKDVDIVSAGMPVECYRWGEKSITYHRCGICGCTTHYTTREADGSDLIAINCRMSAPADISDIPIRRFDGLVTWQYLD